VTAELVQGVASELARCGAGVATLVTESAHEWIDELGDDVERRVVLVGGDGTLHAAVNETDARPEIALIPAGRANNIARSLGIPAAARDAARLAVEGTARRVDLIEAATASRRHITVEAVSVGFLAQARSYYHGENSAHVSTAIAAGVHALADFSPVRVRLRAPGVDHDLRVAQLFVANLPLCGFGLHVAPNADATDELLDVVAIDARGRLAIPPMIGGLLRPHGVDGPSVHRWKVDHASIEVLGASPIVADSFDLGHGTLDVRVLPKDLPLVRP
jgi:diacylglycerol kinase family enzyme